LSAGLIVGGGRKPPSCIIAAGQGKTLLGIITEKGLRTLGVDILQ